MVEHKYAFQSFETEKMARVVGRNLDISHKDAREICSFIKGKKIDFGINYLESVANKEKPVPYKRYKSEIPHKKGNLAGGRYPVKASEAILKLLNGLKSQAEGKGLDIPELRIIHAVTHKGPRAWHYGRQTRRMRKNTHVEFVAGEIKADKKEVKK